MSFRAKAPEIRTISQFNVPVFEFKSSSKKTLYFHHETPGIGAVNCFWLLPVQKHQQNKAFQALAAVEMLLSGGDGKSEYDILKHIEHLGASVGNDSEYLYARIHFRCAKTVLIDVFEWILHHVEKADYPEEELARYSLVKKASLERKMQTPGYWSGTKVKELLYSDIEWIGTAGTPTDFEHLTSEDLNSFHTHFIKNSGGVLFFSGDVSSDECDKMLEIWESTPRKSIDWNLPLEGVNPLSLKELEHKHWVPNTSQISMKWGKHIGPLEESKIHQYTLLNMVLGGYFGSRLMQELREKQGLTYGISSYFQPLWQGRTWYISGEMNSENKDKAVLGVKEILTRLQNESIPQEELDRAKKYYAGIFRSGFDGPFAQATKALQMLVRMHSKNYFADTLEHIWNINSDELLKLAQNELNPNTFVKVLAGDTN